MSAFVIFIIIIAGLIIYNFAKDSHEDTRKVENEGGMLIKYGTLINHFVEPESGMRLIQVTSKYVCVGMNNTSGKVVFHFQHTYSKINVTFEMKNVFLGEHKLNWEFPETMPQEDMISHIETRTRQYMDNVTTNLNLN